MFPGIKISEEKPSLGFNTDKTDFGHQTSCWLSLTANFFMEDRENLKPGKLANKIGKSKSTVQPFITVFHLSFTERRHPR
jgi:hypothetical protein